MSDQEDDQGRGALVKKVMDAIRVLEEREGLVILAIVCDDSITDCKEERSSLKGMEVSKVLGTNYPPN